MNHDHTAQPSRRQFFGQCAVAISAAIAVAKTAAPGALLESALGGGSITPAAMTTAVETAHTLSWQAQVCMGQLTKMQSGAAPFVPGAAAQLQGHIVQCVRDLPAHLRLLSADPGLARRIAQQLSSRGRNISGSVETILEKGPDGFMDQFRLEAEEAQQTTAHIEVTLEVPHAERSWMETVHGPGATKNWERE